MRITTNMATTAPTADAAGFDDPEIKAIYVNSSLKEKM